MVRRALPALHGADPVAEHVDELVHEAALADAGLSRDVGDGAVAAPDLLPGLDELRELGAATDDRGQAASDLRGGPQRPSGRGSRCTFIGRDTPFSAFSPSGSVSK